MPLPPRREPEAEEEQPLEGEPQVVGQRRIFHMSNAMCVKSLGIMPASPLKPRRAMEQEENEGGRSHS